MELLPPSPSAVPPPEPGLRRDSVQSGAWIFLRALGAIFFCAFASLWAQWPGLISRRGILPAAELLERVASQLGSERFWKLPTLFWISSSDGALRGACALGLGLSLCLIAGLAPRWILLALWALYLSFCSVGGVFLSFQWDTLLLETSFFALFVAPSGWRVRWGQLSPTRTSLLLMRWILAKLMLLSGWVKLTSGDPIWRSLNALHYHYWTQPLPTVVGFYAWYLPASVHRVSVAFMFFIELVLPWLLFGPRKLRHGAALGLVLLQLGIAATGNYGFFNALTLALCALQFDDGAYRWLIPSSLRGRLPASSTPHRTTRRILFPIFALSAVFVGVLEAVARLAGPQALPEVAETVLQAVAPFRTVNSYGLFAVMTQERTEIEVAGSNDGLEWKPYGFRWKPGPLHRRPSFTGPHMPRLDWQMWFAALGTCDRNPWFVLFQQRLLEGSPEALSLIEGNPFPEGPPRLIRSTRARYRFPVPRRPGVYWERDEEGEYCPPLTLDRAGNLIRAAGGS